MAVPAAVGVDLRSLLALLADGRLQSGEQLARTLGVSRTAIWKAVGRLRARGILVRTAARRGYALPAAVELLDPIAVRSAMAADRARCLHRLDVAFDVDSTNTRLLHAGPPPDGSAIVLLTELQQGGRGRRGRDWAAPFGGSLALSVAWSFAAAERSSPALSLCVGVAVVRALTRAGAAGVGLKWPNDIWFSDRKMGGVLI
ncbi:MAG: biotin--[acetyl-CoA-carboxylase] ligase, partial [Pseudomonadota bacterium]|nr:biotin--[acetyl-CoA-carboxylase] ligase [Pseudomonadota bacterium]